MAVWSVFVLALGVSADAFAVALGKGLQMRRFDWRRALVVAVTFGAFQAVMPLIGWLLGTQLYAFIEPVDHWIAFGLLVLIGGKMLWDAFSRQEEKEIDARLDVRELLVLAVATSIDALAVGVSLAFVEVSIVFAIATIGLTTLVLTFVGMLVGHRAGLRFRGPAEVVGGLILLGIGTKILLDHLGVFA
ncbi:manganese efflux pump MntP family protein [Herbiconiux moechotypicola]|uniref:Putative manganese efflux pump MntP n=1 Tax=Herbiconiux moechotypicola TaxID=637393 RepID=A0ABP5R217_9MICO|nr:manganese efflux pump MntP family protein [Herbiconiux moechotypicola]MCS5731604.1 manganese efflux pump MntP family protein [Herbiconiux moechotypicola]